MGERLAAGNVAIALLANSLATAGGLYVLILAFAPVSGAHFNPVVTLAEALAGELPWRDVFPYIAVQLVSAIAGTWITHAMFGLELLQFSTKPRSSAALWLGELVATFGLVTCIRLIAPRVPHAVPASVAAFIGAAYWFTSSSSFANPAITIARSLTDTFAGIAPGGILPFIAAQLVGGFAALHFCRWLAAPKSP